MNKVKAGFFAFTELTDAARHVEFNWWHSSDHQPENMALRVVALAKRWAAPRKYIEARPFCYAAFAKHQYLMHYLFQAPVTQTAKDFSELGALVRGLPGRFFTARNIWSFGHHMFLKGFVAPRLEIAPEALPYRPNNGVLLVINHVKDAAQLQRISRWQDEVHLPDMLALKGVTGCYWFQAAGEAVLDVAGIPKPAARQVILFYLDEDPLVTVADLRAKLPAWRSAGRMLESSAGLENVLTAPYVNIENPASMSF